MVSDKEASIGKSIGLLNTTSWEYERAILVCSPEGKVAYMQISNASLGRNIEDLLRVVQWLNHLLRHPERLCQEDWHDGEEGIHECTPETHVFVH
jgi:alkyl hydroperoxide reductase subunit AhpC